MLAGPEGLDAADRRVGRRPRPQRPRRVGRPGPDGRDARRGHRPRARQQGEPRRRRRARDAARRGDRGTRAARRLRALGALPAPATRGAGHGRAARADRLRGAVSRPRRGVAQGRRPRAGARAPDLGHGRQDHDRLGDADEQGPRADRGPPPVRLPLRAHRRRRPSGVDRPRGGPPQRRLVDRAPRLSGHAWCRSLTRFTFPSGSTFRSPQLDLAADRAAHLRGARSRDLPLPGARARGGDRRRHRPLCPERGERGGGARVPRRQARVSSTSRA